MPSKEKHETRADKNRQITTTMETVRVCTTITYILKNQLEVL